MFRFAKGLWFYTLVSIAIIVMHFWSTQSNISPEPGPAAMSIYSNYNAIIRAGGDDSIGFEPALPYRDYLNNEVSQMVKTQATCAKLLKDKTKTCQASNVIEGSSKLQHWKSYLLPSVVSGLSFSKQDLAEMKKFSSSNLSKPREPTEQLYKSLRTSGIIFFNFLLFLKLVIWALLWFGLREKIAALYFGSSFIIISIWGFFLDQALHRGAGVYSVDQVIAGSPSFNAETSRLVAMTGALFGSLKAVAGPTAATTIFGIPPRSTAIFIAAAIFVPIVSTRTWKFVWLIPIGFAVHFTTFVALATFGFLLVLLLGVRPDRRAIANTLGAIALSGPVFYYQKLYEPGFKPEFSYVSLLMIMSMTLLLPLGLSLQRENNLNLERERPLRLGLTAILAFVVIASLTILNLASRYGYSDTQGFWLDGLLRELAGRLAPFTTVMALTIPGVMLVRGCWFGFNETFRKWTTREFKWLLKSEAIAPVGLVALFFGIAVKYSGVFFV